MEQTEQKQTLPELHNLSGGLEILVQLAEKGDIDPWDIDILEVTDKYLAALDKSPRENLLNAGRAIFFASVLLRLKSDILLNISNETLLASQQAENFFPEDDLLDADNEVRLDLSKLESFIVRSSLSKQQRKRKISLGDLIFALQQAEEEEERRALRAKMRADRAFTIVAPETPDEILEIAHEEDIDEVVEKIEAIIQEHLTEEKPITLTFLSEILNNKSKPFVALLFLAHSQKIVLEQKDMYDEVYIHKAGTVIEEPKNIEPEKMEIVKKKSKAKNKKKGIFGRLKDKIQEATNHVIARSEVTKQSPNELTKETKEIPEITIEMNTSEEVTLNGNDNREQS